MLPRLAATVRALARATPGSESARAASRRSSREHLTPSASSSGGLRRRVSARAAFATDAGARDDAASTAPRPEWVADIAARLPPRFPDAPSEYWTGGERGVGGTQVHGQDTILSLLHGAGAFHHPALHVDAPNAEVLLTLRTGARTAGHPGWTHGGFTSLLADEMAGQAYAHFVQPERGPGVTANLTLDYAAPLPTETDLLVVAGVRRVEGRKVWLGVEVRDGPRPDASASAAEDEDRARVFAAGSALFIVLEKDKE